MEIKQAEAAIEAILFAMGDSVELEKIAKAIQQDTETTRKIIGHMMDGYREEGPGASRSWSLTEPISSARSRSCIRI